MTNEQFQEFMMEIAKVFNKYGTGEALIYVRDEKDKKLWLVHSANDGKVSEAFSVVNHFLVHNLKDMKDFVLFEKVVFVK